MLTVYTYPTKPSDDCIDLSRVPLDELVDSAMSIFHHQKKGSIHVWLGYLDGWMLTPHEETRLRKVVRTFSCSVVSCFPISFSHAWKNEIDTIYTSQPNGNSNPDNNGRSVHNGSTIGHKQTSQ